MGKIVFNSIDGGERVSSIDIFDNRNELLRSVRFNTTAFDESGRWNALNSVEFLDSRRVCDSRYLFEYNDVRFPQVEHTNALDYWGYYNGCNDNTSLIPNFYLTFKRNQVKMEHGVCWKKVCYIIMPSGPAIELLLNILPKHIF